MSERTAGPWTVSEARTIEGEYMVVGGPGQEFGLIAAVTELADAKAIAALPDYENLRNEVAGVWNLYADSLRCIMGNTNYAVVADKLAALLPV